MYVVSIAQYCGNHTKADMTFSEMCCNGTSDIIRIKVIRQLYRFYGITSSDNWKGCLSEIYEIRTHLKEVFAVLIYNYRVGT